MHILIAGVGALGRQVAESLVALRHDVVAIDISKSACEAVYAELGVVAVHGSATDVHVLEEAGARKADVVVTAMHSDAEIVTQMAVMIARQAKDLRQRMMVQISMKMDFVMMGMKMMMGMMRSMMEKIIAWG